MWTGEVEKAVYINTLLDFMRPGRVHWAQHFVSERPAAVQKELSQQLCFYRRERREGADPAWQAGKSVLSGKAPGLRDDLMMALQMALYWGLVTLDDPRFQRKRSIEGWT